MSKIRIAPLSAPPAPSLSSPDLNGYIPIGSVTINSGPENDGVAPPDDWVEIKDVPLPLNGNERLQCPLQSLLEENFVRVFIRRHQLNDKKLSVRVYALPDDVGRRFEHRKARSHVTLLMGLLDRSFESWEGQNRTFERPQQEQSSNDSLSYIFNTLPSPSPTLADVSCQSAKSTMRDLLSADCMWGLKTRLFPYQKRSAAEMIRREFEPKRRLDPRFEAVKGPTGQHFYFSSKKGIIYCDPREYDDARGGILAETMGFGKTLICLATILATKGHWPRIPPEYLVDLYPLRPKVGSLMQMATATIGREQIPFRKYFQKLADAGAHHERCVAMLEENIGSYFICTPNKNRRKQPVVIKREQIHLCPATLILVPPNLFQQWKSEIALHLEQDVLKVLYMESSETKMPSKIELLSYDVVLMSKRRFEQEIDNNENCRSPLQEVHFLRIIADEGHAFASSTGWKNKATQALQNLHVERRWAVSGTPAAGLLGVEVNLAANETFQGQAADSETCNKLTLQALRNASPLGQEQKDLLKLGSLVTDFLSLSPWANSRSADFASWNSYIMPHKSGRRKRSLRPVLESLVVRHRIEDVQKEIKLPLLHNRVVYLQPSWHDKLSINLFVLSLTSNIVTSERVDRDYMFHHRNRAQLDRLIANLRQSGFYWTGFSAQDVGNTLEWSVDYLRKTTDLHWSGDPEDRKLLITAVNMGRLAKESASWKAFADLSEIGIYVENFPEDACESWSLVTRSKEDPLLFGATQLIQAQKFVDTRLYCHSPASGLAELGTSLMEDAWQRLDNRAKGKNIIPRDNDGGSPRKKRRVQRSQVGGDLDHAAGSLTAAVEPFDVDSPLPKARISGTASAKLSYLLDKVIALQQEEKIIIFYEGDQIGFYISQGLDILKIEHLIYTATLSVDQRNRYIETFNRTESCRVFLMNVHQAAHGLHLAAASRIFFVNPVWQPNVEAQAIKRAHRIGQTRPVYVETLVLKDTLEDHMLRRRKQMTTEEHQAAKKSLLDDPNMLAMIQGMKPIRITRAELQDVHNHMARLETPQQLFGRGCGAPLRVIKTVSHPVATREADTPRKEAGRGRKRKVAFLEPDQCPPIEPREASPELGFGICRP